MSPHGLEPNHVCRISPPACNCSKTAPVGHPNHISNPNHNDTNTTSHPHRTNEPHNLDACHDYEALPETSSFSNHMFAGALAGIAEHAFMYPLDSIKTRMQLQNKSTPMYTSIRSSLRYMRRQESLKRLWRGVTSMIVGAGPAHAVYFATYEQCKEYFGANQSGYHFATTALAGACATVCSDALMNPFDVIKQRLQMHGSPHKSALACARSVIRTEGFSALYVSYPTTLTMTIPFQSIHFAAYEFMRKTLNPKQQYHPPTHLIAGAFAGAIAAATTNPLDVAKTLLQTRGQHTDLQVRQCNGLTTALTLIWRRDGFQGFFRGLRPRVLAHMPSTAICWSTYEFVKWRIATADTDFRRVMDMPHLEMSVA